MPLTVSPPRTCHLSRDGWPCSYSGSPLSRWLYQPGFAEPVPRVYLDPRPPDVALLRPESRIDPGHRHAGSDSSAGLSIGDGRDEHDGDDDRDSCAHLWPSFRTSDEPKRRPRWCVVTGPDATRFRTCRCAVPAFFPIWVDGCSIRRRPGVGSTRRKRVARAVYRITTRTRSGTSPRRSRPVRGVFGLP